MVKNNGYIGLSPSDYQHWAEKLKEAGLDDSTWPLPAPFYSIVTKSWERIFDLEQLEDGGEWGVWHLQIAFEELSIKNITKVTVY